ncbi:hypothetical protein BU26DRAFT_384520, partial [Trematosphaeria pertusa]
YLPLETPTSIRLIVIEPGATDAPLVCKLAHVDLSINPPYEAISYVWGTPVYSHHFSCNGRIMRMTGSLHEALLRVRLPDRRRTIWADGICINQADLQERGHQVKFMRDVYQKAHRVLVWLGSDPSSVAPAVFTSFRRLSQGKSISPNVPFSIFARCKWFSRLWVLQEIILAKRAIL